MTDFVSRQAAINTIKNGFHWETVNGITAQAVLKQVIHDIEIMPSVQPERKRGEWYKPKEYPRDSYRYICSNCQDVAYYVTGNNGKKQKEDKPKCGYRYCPNCGADMR